MLYQSALGQVSMQAGGRVRPYQPQVPGLGDSRETVTQVSPMLTRAPNKARVCRQDSVRVRAEGRQAIPRCAPGTLLNQCRLHKPKKHTVLVVATRIGVTVAGRLEPEPASE